MSKKNYKKSRKYKKMRRRKISGAFLLLFSNLCFFYAVTFGCFTRMARIAFRIAMTETPTSANTAAHIFAYPKSPKISTSNLTPRANTMF